MDWLISIVVLILVSPYIVAGILAVPVVVLLKVWFDGTGFSAGAGVFERHPCNDPAWTRAAEKIRRHPRLYGAGHFNLLDATSLGWIIAIGVVVLALAAMVTGADAKDNNPFSGATSIEVAMTRDAPDVQTGKKPPSEYRQRSKFNSLSLTSTETCTASEYGIGDGYHGKRAADGSIFNTHASAPYTVAHRTRRLGSYVTVTNLATGLSVRAKVTDRGPFYHARCVDLGRAGALAIGMSGLAKVMVR